MTETTKTPETDPVEPEVQDRIIPDFKRFVAIDIETTGLDPAEGEIIELGAVQFVNGIETETFRTLVKPEKGYPERNRRLTGIDPAMLAEGQPVVEALADFKNFIGDDLLVSHNAPFDTAFLAWHVKKHDLDPIENPALCTLHLSAFINPEAVTLQLATLAKNWDVEVIDPHRAMQDARMAGRMAVKLINELKSWPGEFVAHLGSYRGKSFDPIFDLLDSVVGDENYELTSWCFRDKVIDRLKNPDKPAVLPEFKLRSYSPTLEFPDDPELADEFRNTFKNGGVSIIEDNRTGSGPVSRSIPPGDSNLPATVVGIPDEETLAAVLGPDETDDGTGGPAGAVYLGRRSEYICVSRAFDADGRPAGWLELSPFERLVFCRWLAGTHTGRVARVNWWLLNNYSGLKGHLNALSGSELDCPGFDESHGNKCFAELSRRKAESAARIIVDHKHLCTKPSKGQLSDRMLDSVGACVIERASRLVHAARATEGRILELDLLYRRLATISESGDSDGQASGNGDVMREAAKHIGDLLNTCKRTIRAYRETHSPAGASPIPIDDESWTDEIFSELSGALDLSSEGLQNISKTILSGSDLSQSMMSIALMLERSAETIRLFAKTPAGWATSLEGAPARNPKRVTLRISPVEIGDVTRHLIDQADKGLILTDRNLRFRGSFERIKSIWDIPQDVDVSERVLEDPSIILPPVFLPEDVNAPTARSGRRYHWQKYMERTANLLRMLAESLGGRTLAAFSAHHELRKVREILEDNPPRDCIVLAQYMDGTKSSLIREYINNPATLLLGGRNFLDSVDLRTAGFTALVLVKLPFVSPEEPIHRATLKTLEAQGIDGMVNYLVPLAAETSNRWIDSLVRGSLPEHADEGSYPGAVILLDPRAATNEWGDDLIASLIAQPVHRMSFREMLVRLKEMAQGTNTISSSSS